MLCHVITGAITSTGNQLQQILKNNKVHSSIYNIKTHVYVVHLGAVHDMPCPKVVQHFLHLFGFVNSGETFFDRPHNSQRMLSEL